MKTQAAPRAPAGSAVKKDTARQKSRNHTFEALSEYSLSEFLENEPDIYSVSDLKVRYK